MNRPGSRKMEIRNVPFVDLAQQNRTLRDEMMEAIGGVFDHGQFILGAEVETFEERFAEYCNLPYAVGLNSGLDALILGLRALDVGPGDEVITPPNSYIASSGAIGLLDARPVFVDVKADYNIDPSTIEAAITERTKAIMPVHLTGRPCEMDTIREIADRHSIPIIEDAAQSITARYKNQATGSLGAIGCFSLHPLKTLNACGDGGVVTTGDPKIYQRLLQLRNHGLKNRDECVEWGYNSRLDSIQAAILLVKLKHIEEWTEQRRTNAKIYQTELHDVGDLILPGDQEHEYSAYHTFIIRTKNRDALNTHLREQGVGTGVHYPIPIHLQEAAAYLGYSPGDFPEAELQATEILSLPIHQGLVQEDLSYVVDCVKSFFEIT
jgi:dTDP-4-amino-4,6-dideoxygalactose transaminase